MIMLTDNKATGYKVGGGFGLVVASVYPPAGVTIFGRAGECKPWTTSDIVEARAVKDLARENGLAFAAVETA